MQQKEIRDASKSWLAENTRSSVYKKPEVTMLSVRLCDANLEDEESVKTLLGKILTAAGDDNFRLMKSRLERLFGRLRSKPYFNQVSVRSESRFRDMARKDFFEIEDPEKGI